jgi:hypothetical protein
MVKAVLLSVLTVWMFLAIVLEAGLWALLYLFLFYPKYLSERVVKDLSRTRKMRIFIRFSYHFFNIIQTA